MRRLSHSAFLVASITMTATPSFALRHDCAKEREAASSVVLQKYNTALRGLQEMRDLELNASALRRIETGGTDLILRKGAAFDGIQLLSKRCSMVAKSKILGIASRYVLLSDKYLVRLQMYRNQAQAKSSEWKFSTAAIPDKAGLKDNDRSPMAALGHTDSVSLEATPDHQESNGTWLASISEVIDWLSRTVDSAYLLLAALLTGIGGWVFIKWRKNAAAANASLDRQATS